MSDVGRPVLLAAHARGTTETLWRPDCGSAAEWGRRPRLRRTSRSGQPSKPGKGYKDLDLATGGRGGFGNSPQADSLPHNQDTNA